MVVVQFMIFSELNQALKMFVFILSPQTWMSRPYLDDGSHMLFRWGFDHALFMMPLVLLTTICKVGVAYMVSTTSLSIILSCDRVTDAIFNSLALTFIMDLDSTVWGMLNSTTDVKVCDPSTPSDEFKFKHQVKRVRQAHKVSESGLRHVLVGVAVACIFIDQITVTLAALATGWLPVTRVLCGMWDATSAVHADEVAVEEGSGWGAKKLDVTLDHCRRNNFVKWTTEKYSRVIKEHPKVWWTSVILVVTFLALPPLLKLSMKEMTRPRSEQEAREDKRTLRVGGEGLSEDESSCESSE